MYESVNSIEAVSAKTAASTIARHKCDIAQLARILKTSEKETCWCISYPYGTRIVHNNHVATVMCPQGDTHATQRSTIFPPPGSSTNDYKWIGIVVERNVSVTTSHGIYTDQKYSVNQLHHELKGDLRSVLRDDLCLKFRTTIRNVLRPGAVFRAWEIATHISQDLLGVTNAEEDLYRYDIHAGDGPVVLVWPLGQIRSRNVRVPDGMQPGHQLLNYSSELVLQHLVDITARTALATKVLWIPTDRFLELPEFRKSLLAYAWTQARASRIAVLRQERVADAIAHLNQYDSTRPISPLFKVGCLTATLCYIDDALAGRVPLYRFVTATDGGIFSEIACQVSRRLATCEQSPQRFLLAPRIDGAGGMVSLSMPVAQGPITTPETESLRWTPWLKAFNEFWINRPHFDARELRKLLPAIYGEQADSLLLTTYSSANRGRAKSVKEDPVGSLSRRNTPYFNAVIELHGNNEGALGNAIVK